MELERGAGATPVRGLGVGVTGPSLPYGMDSTKNWDKDGEYSPCRAFMPPSKIGMASCPVGVEPPLAAKCGTFLLGRH